MRRSNLRKFPYHILFEERIECNRIILRGGLKPEIHPLPSNRLPERLPRDPASESPWAAEDAPDQAVSNHR